MPLLSDTIKTLRRRSGLTQVELAQRAGVSQSAVSLIEKGKMQPSAEVYAALVGALGLTVDWTPQRPKTPALIKLNSAVALLDEQELDCLADLACVWSELPASMLSGLILLGKERQRDRRTG